jgi:hypothetical protein
MGFVHKDPSSGQLTPNTLSVFYKKVGDINTNPGPDGYNTAVVRHKFTGTDVIISNPIGGKVIGDKMYFLCVEDNIPKMGVIELIDGYPVDPGWGTPSDVPVLEGLYAVAQGM